MERMCMARTLNQAMRALRKAKRSYNSTKTPQAARRVNAAAQTVLRLKLAFSAKGLTYSDKIRMLTEANQKLISTIQEMREIEKPGQDWVQ